MGTITIGSNGGFSNWQIAGQNLGSRATWMLKLSTQNPNKVSANSFSTMGFSLYPNPAGSQVQVKLSEGKGIDGLAEIYNIEGVRVFSSKITGNQSTIQTSEWMPGVYFVKLTSQGNSRTERLVIQK